MGRMRKRALRKRIDSIVHFPETQRAGLVVLGSNEDLDDIQVLEILNEIDREKTGDGPVAKAKDEVKVKLIKVAALAAVEAFVSESNLKVREQIATAHSFSPLVTPFSTFFQVQKSTIFDFYSIVLDNTVSILLIT